MPKGEEGEWMDLMVSPESPDATVSGCQAGPNNRIAQVVYRYEASCYPVHS